MIKDANNVTKHGSPERQKASIFRLPSIDFDKTNIANNENTCPTVDIRALREGI